MWYYECLPNYPVCKAFVLFGSHYNPTQEEYALTEARYWANEAGIKAFFEGVKLEYKGVLLAPVDSSSLILSANGEY